MAAVHEALRFDAKVGLRNNLKKFVAMSTCPDARSQLAKVTFGGEYISVSLDEVLVGHNITVRRSARRTLQDTRILEGIKIARRAAASGVGVELKIMPSL